MRIEKANQAFTDITGYHAEEVIGKTPRLFKSACTTAPSTLDCGMPYWRPDTGRAKSGIATSTAISIRYGSPSPRYATQPAKCHFIAVFHSIAERKANGERAGATGYPRPPYRIHNRRAFDRFHSPGDSPLGAQRVTASRYCCSTSTTASTILTGNRHWLRPRAWPSSR
ncbi:hypothetical protein DSL92_01120 [Billgrantia gudaonensis]|uniref:PAS domain-containing protein n=1 Tax=Billgrantia gudaonensis TaxID=376427 RepID=A0A432JM41_9GAMM|nr:hypothetical protein DSL92_01120 [Halomonas gudaonensis]